MQESNFEPFTSGPPTYTGIAKGMWQFIPETGERYGLKIGPLRGCGRRPGRRSARLEESHHRRRAVHQGYLRDRRAGVRPARHGLLQLGRGARHQPAAEHAGESAGAELLEGPREAPRPGARHQTYDYVFYIVAAAVIGENPRLFGFKFDNPLAFAEQAIPAGPK